MSLAKAFSQKVRNFEFDAASRSFGSRRAAAAPPGINRAQISLPVALVSATNPLAFEAPDLPEIQATIAKNPHILSNRGQGSPDSKQSFDNESEKTPSLASSGFRTPDFSRDTSPTMPSNTQMTYFLNSPPLDQKSALSASKEAEIHSNNRNGLKSPPMDGPPPSVPKRAPSHTKATHQLAHQRSVSRLRTSQTSNHSNEFHSAPSSPRSSTRMSLREKIRDAGLLAEELSRSDDSSASSPSESPNSKSSLKVKTDYMHPFGAELAQVDELAEEFATSNQQRNDPPSPSEQKREETLNALAPLLKLNTSRSNVSNSSPSSAQAPPTSIPSQEISSPSTLKSPVVPYNEVVILDEDEKLLLEQGFCKFAANDYLAEIAGLLDSVYPLATSRGVGAWL